MCIIQHFVLLVLKEKSSGNNKMCYPIFSVASAEKKKFLEQLCVCVYYPILAVASPERNKF